MSILPEKYFFIIIEHGKSAILDRGDKNIKLGDFFMVKYVFNSRATEANRAQHIITQIKPMNPLADVRIDEDNMGRKHVWLRTTAKCNDMVYLPKGKRVSRLYNDVFGYFIDMMDLVRVKNKLIDFEFKCKASENDKYSSIFVPVNIIGYLDLPKEFDIKPTEQEHRLLTTGFVCSQIQPKGHRFVWANNLEKDAILNEQFCPVGVEVSGRWVEMIVNTVNNHVVGMVKIVADIFPTRIQCTVPEVEICFDYDGFFDNGGYHIFRNPDFGLICDPEKVVRNISEEQNYIGWVVRQKTSIPGCRWKISSFQRDIHPEISRQNARLSVADDYHHDSRDELPSSSQVEGDKFRSEEVSDRFDNDQSYMKQWNQDHSSDEVGYSSQSSGSRASTTDSEDENEQRKEVSSSLDDVVPARRRSRILSSNGDDQRSVGSNEHDNMNNYERDLQITENGNGERSSRASITGTVTPPRADYVSVSSNYGTPVRDIAPSAEKPKYSSDQELKFLQKKLQSYHSLVKFFTDNKKVFNEMLKQNRDKLDELMELQCEK
uniref:Uncharacterized protein n=1 Tax=Caenorhabditis tropicalis TaxID=1561998 RepID=A0A1I7T0K8_9PELO